MYVYAKERERLFTEDGLAMYVSIRDNVRTLLRRAGAVSLGAAIQCATGDSWLMLACVDRMVEVGELTELASTREVSAQERVFVAGPKWRES